MSIEINLLPEYKKSILENKVTLVKNFSKISTEYDFNSLVNFIENYDPKILQKTNGDVFQSCFSIPRLQGHFHDFSYFQNFLREVFNYTKQDMDGCDIFFSLKSGAGECHSDEEDVFLIGLNGTTNYKTIGKEINNYKINKGDLLFIPRGILHKVIPLSSRIVLSIAFWGCKR